VSYRAGVSNVHSAGSLGYSFALQQLKRDVSGCSSVKRSNRNTAEVPLGPVYSLECDLTNAGRKKAEVAFV
jgi:hypothetical protein